jgi:hypothetical protein
MACNYVNAICAALSGALSIDIDHISIEDVNISGGCGGDNGDTSGGDNSGGATPPTGVFPSTCDVYLKGVNGTTVTGASFFLKDFNTNGSSSTLNKGGTYQLDGDNKFRFYIDKHGSAAMVDSFYQQVNAAIVDIGSDVDTANFWLRGDLTINYTKAGNDWMFTHTFADVTIAMFHQVLFNYWNFGGANMEVAKSVPISYGAFNEIRETGTSLYFKFPDDSFSGSHNTIEFWAA